MNFDGSPVYVGDTIHHAVYGSGTVNRMTTNSAKVRFGDQELELPVDGMLGGVKVWFWTPRTILNPVKPTTQQAAQYQTLIQTAYDVVFKS